MSKNDYINSFREIRRARDNNKLVIFVGAGISRNSHLPSWNDLVKSLAEEINYPPYIQNKKKYQFSTDEYLKIPQYAFDKNSKKYYEILKGMLDVPAEPNSLNKIILKLLPNHIITTNYDKLIEKTDDINNLQYKVISSDKDLLVSQGDHYIIKMHGDIDDISNIVLREDDYLNYTNNHILLETFIKSLFVDHTFLFVGYSINDYNLKQIMSWIDYLSSKESVSDVRHKNFIIQEETPNDYEIKYWGNKKLSIIDSSSLDESLIEKYKPKDLRQGVASRLYACLEIINDENADIYITDYDEFLLEVYSIFDSMENIYIDDLLKVSGIGNVIFSDGKLTFYDKETYMKWKSLIDNKKICDYWISAGISRLENSGIGNREVIQLEKKKLLSPKNEIDSLFSFLINFQFGAISTALKKKNIPNHVKYYYEAQISMNNSNVTKYYFNSIESDNSLTKFNSAIYKYNSFLLKNLAHSKDNSKDDVLKFIGMFSKQEKRAFNYLASIIQDGSDLRKSNQAHTLLSKTESSYASPPTFTSEMYGKLPKMRSNAYQHFFYIKGNGILLDNFSETIDFFESYIKCMLVTQKEIKINNQGFGINGSLQKYPINLVDVNIIVLFAKYTNMKKYLTKGNISSIIYEENLDLVSLFDDFCASALFVLEKGNYIFPLKFSNFSMLLRYSNLSDTDMGKIESALAKLLSNDNFVFFMNRHREIETEVLELILKIIQKERILSVDIIVLLIKNLSEEARYSYLFSKIISYLSRNGIYSTSRKIQLSIDKTRKVKQVNQNEWISFLVTMYPIMSKYSRSKYTKEIKNNVLSIDSFKIIDMINIGIVEFDGRLKNKYIDQIKDAAERNKSGVSSFPDPLEVAIENLLVLHLLGIIEDIEFLKDYISLSSYLEFIFQPQQFDYSMVDLDDYMWINFFKSEKYIELILKYGKDVLKDKIVSNIELGIASEEQKKVFYRYIVDENDFWKY